MTAAKADFIVQLGDFCIPKDANRPFLAESNRFAGPRFHVIGNHDMDGGFSREQVASFLGMPARHYAFDGGAFTGVVLDGNEPGGRATGYARFIGAEQQAWLERTLLEARGPVIVFVHQPVEAGFGVENGAEVRAILERVEAAHPGRILATIAGHLHMDYVQTMGRLPYLQINSASYYWLGEAGARSGLFPAEVEARHPNLKYVAAYRDPLWALVEVDPAAGELRVRGRATPWVGPAALDRAPLEDRSNREDIRPAISDRRIARRFPG
jgi:3',5'-cyclic AMP phosphodiesterase CpdA